MAKKKVPTMEDAIKSFKEVMLRASLSSYYQVNKILLSINPNDNKILIIPDLELWNALCDEYMKILDDETTTVDVPWKELDVTKPDQYQLQKYFRYGEELEKDWIDIAIDEELFSGKVFKIRVNDFEYPVSINRDLMPLKLKKAEYVNISYRIFYQQGKSEYIGAGVTAVTPQVLILAIKKRFDPPKDVEGGGFTMIRLFQVI